MARSAARSAASRLFVVALCFGGRDPLQRHLDGVGAWFADALLAQRLGWAHAVPLLGTEAALGGAPLVVRLKGRRQAWRNGAGRVWDAGFIAHTMNPGGAFANGKRQKALCPSRQQNE
ncbi:hypothetical protein [Mesorhizobium sp. M0118]|uniref:hypothetical protein n=1 Tax=Mesorhizobium sp. M0118 TaxID=2956884 RepID=UPI00333D827A